MCIIYFFTSTLNNYFIYNIQTYIIDIKYRDYKIMPGISKLN